MLILVYTLFALKLPQDMAYAGDALKTGGAVTFVLYAGIIIFLVLLKRQTMRTLHWTGVLLKPLPQRISSRILLLLGSFISGIRISSKGGHVGALLLSSLLIWAFCVIPVYTVLLGFGINLPITASMFILVLLVFAVMVPASPGYIGTYHYACFKGLSAFGIPESIAVTVALVIHATSFFPVIIAGGYYVWKNKLSFSELQGTEKTA
jgi:uncharacterized protein (TIRG00374 family)